MLLRTIRNPSCLGKTFHGLSVFRMKYVQYKQNIRLDDFFLPFSFYSHQRTGISAKMVEEGSPGCSLSVYWSA